MSSSSRWSGGWVRPEESELSAIAGEVHLTAYDLRIRVAAGPARRGALDGGSWTKAIQGLAVDAGPGSRGPGLRRTKRHPRDGDGPRPAFRPRGQRWLHARRPRITRRPTVPPDARARPCGPHRTAPASSALRARLRQARARACGRQETVTVQEHDSTQSLCTSSPRGDGERPFILRGTRRSLRRARRRRGTRPTPEFPRHNRRLARARTDGLLRRSPRRRRPCAPPPHFARSYGRPEGGSSPWADHGADLAAHLLAEWVSQKDADPVSIAAQVDILGLQGWRDTENREAIPRPRPGSPRARGRVSPTARVSTRSRPSRSTTRSTSASASRS